MRAEKAAMPVCESSARRSAMVAGRCVPRAKLASRVQISFTGRPTAFEAATARRTKSCSPRRPKPPPRNVVCTKQRSLGTPETLAAVVRDIAWARVPTQTSQRSSVTWAVQDSGSSCAWSRYGLS